MGLYRRAATLWMDIFKRSSNDPAGTWLKQRQRCLKGIKQAKTRVNGIWNQFNEGH
jgi:hypothetical protein